MEGEHPGFTYTDVLVRDLAEGKAAKEELKRLKQIIMYASENHPQKNSILIEVTIQDRLAAKIFRELIEKYAEIVAKEEEL